MVQPSVKDIVNTLVTISDNLANATARLQSEQATIDSLNAQLAVLIQQSGTVLFSNPLFSQLVTAFNAYQQAHP